MKVNVPGFPTRYVDEDPPVEEVVVAEAPLPSVEEAIRLAQERHGEVIPHTRDVPPEASPLLDMATATIDPGVNPSAALEHGAGPAVVPVGTSEPVQPVTETPKFDE